jgi:pyruvate carboxylase
MMGQPAWGFPKDLQKIVLRGEEPITCRPGELLAPADFNAAREAVAKVKQGEPTNRDVVSWLQFPNVVEGYYRHHQEYDHLTDMPSSVFFHGMGAGQTTMFDIEDGKTLVIKYIGVGDANEDGTRNFQFELNGMRREIPVADPSLVSTVKQVIMAEPENKSHVAASIPGMISKLNIKSGDTVKESDVLAVVEAMKMEINIVARMDGVIDKVLLEAGQAVKAGELMAVIK